MPSFRLLTGLLFLFSCATACSNGDDSSQGNTPGDVPGGDLDASMGVPFPDGCDASDTSYDGFVASLVEERCLPCHSSALEGADRLAAPPGIDFDSEDDVAFHQERIRARAVVDRTMPPGAPLDDCEAARLSAYLDTLGGQGACEPSCAGVECGDDGCGGSCGGCGASEYCSEAGTCVAADCSPSCQGVACGDDGCGGSCGACGPGLACGDAGQCVCAPQCDGRSCGDDGCGGVCGSCGGDEVCGQAGTCVCIPSCAPGQQCGDDGCGGSCGGCAPGDSCTASDTCECVPSCSPGQQCGSDGCGGTCGTGCAGALQCNTRTGRCVANCMPDCDGRMCGDDGCGGDCGGCDPGLGCTDAGQCECIPDCIGKACGDDGCGGSCGACSDGLACTDGQCGCTASCDGRDCGSDGCGGSCGTCDGGLTCGLNGTCAAQCMPSCDATQECGNDGCGGSCGGCSGGATCQDGSCVLPDVSFAEVYAIFESAGCGTMACHGGVMAAEGLDLSSQSTAQAALVDVVAAQCNDGRKLAEPGNPSGSYLIHKLTGIGMCSGSQMPKTGGALSNAEIDSVRAWISGL